MKPQLPEVGRAGTPIFGGQIYDEYQYELSGSEKYITYDRMRRSDSMVSAALDMLKLPVLQAHWDVDPAPEDKEMGEDVAEFVRRQLYGDEGSDTWQYILNQALLMVDFGYIPMEKVWELIDRPKTLANIKAPPKVIWLKKLAPRMPFTVSEWVYRGGSPESGPLLGIRQQLPLGGQPFIPIEKLCIFTNKKEGDNWEGRAALRTAYKDWFIKDRLEKINAIGHERVALGIPVFELEAGYGIDPDTADGQRLLDRLEDIAANLHANQKNYVITVPGVTFRFEVPKADNSGVLDSIKMHGHGILANILAQFMDLGNTETGSRAVAREQHDPFTLGLLALADNIKATLGRFVVRDIVTFNFGERPGYPSVTHSGIEDADLSTFATMLKDLAAAGFVTMDEPTEDWVREKVGLPAKVWVETEPEEPIEEPTEPDVEDVSDTEDVEDVIDEGQRKEFAETLFMREPTEAECYVAFEEIHFHLEASKERFQAIVGAAARQSLARLIEDATRAVKKGSAAKLQFKLSGARKAVTEELSSLAAYGARQVAEEHERARRKTPVRRAYQNEWNDDWDEEDLEPLTTKEGLTRYAKEKGIQVTTLIAGLVLPAIMAEVMRLYRIGADEAAARTSLGKVAEAALDKALRQAANGNTASAFGMGRAMEIEAQFKAGEAVGAYYSCLLDTHACDACLMRDGEYYTPDMPEFYAFEDGNSEECEGGEQCRCMLFLVYSDEGTR